MNYMDFYAWLVIFGVGLGLLGILVLGRWAQGRRADRRAIVDAKVARLHPQGSKPQKQTFWKGEAKRGIR